MVAPYAAFPSQIYLNLSIERLLILLLSMNYFILQVCTRFCAGALS
jgi:hypothetical protein